MMRERTARLDQLVSYPSREGQICDPVAVQMADLPPAHPELHAAEPMRTDLHATPRRNGRNDFLRPAGLLSDHVRRVGHRP